MRKKLNPKTIDGLKPRAKSYETSDSEIPALKCRVQKTGARTLSLVYRSPLTKKKARLKLQRWPAPGDRVDRAELMRIARGAAHEALAKIGRGEDPQFEKREQRTKRVAAERRLAREEKERARAARTFGDVAEEYLGSPDSSSLKSWPRIQSQLYYHWRDGEPDVWNASIESLRAPDFKGRIDGFIRAKAFGSAAQARKHAGLVMSYAARMGYVVANPVSALRITRVGRDRETAARHLDMTEIGAAWVATRFVREPWATAFRLLMTTGCRKTEVLSIAWDLIGDDDGAHFEIPKEVEKMERGRRVELSELAAKQLISFPRLEGSRYVFSNRTGTGWLTGIEKPKRTWMNTTIEILEEAGYEGREFRLHDTRHSFKTWAAESRIDEDVSEQILGHVKQGISGRYSHARLVPEQRNALEQWAGAILEAAAEFDR